MITKKDARKFAYDLIQDGKNCVTKLTEEDKEILTAHIINGHDKRELGVYEFITEADIHSELPFMLAEYMTKRDSDSAQNLLDYLVDNAVRYAGNTIVDLLLEQEKEYEFNLSFDGD